MTDDVQPLPPPVHPGAQPAADPTVPLRHPAALFAAAAGLGIASGLIVGGAIFALVLSIGSTDCSSSDGWCELGAAILALFAGVLAGGIAYVVAGITTIFRCRPKGLRAPHIGAHLVLPAGFVLVMFLLGVAVDLVN